MPKSKVAAPDADEGKRHSLNMRTTKRTRDALDLAATVSGRSLVQEVEYRLERSFESEREQGGLHTDVLMRFIATGLRLMETTYGAKWTDDEATAAACRAFVDTSLDSFMKAAAPVRQGILGMLATNLTADDRKRGERMALAMRRERLQRVAIKRGDKNGAIQTEISSIDARLHSLADPFSEPLPDLSDVGKLPPGPLDGLLSSGKTEEQRLEARIAADTARLAELRTLKKGKA